MSKSYWHPIHGEVTTEDGYSEFVWCIEDCIFANKERVKEAKRIILGFGDDFYEVGTIDGWDKYIVPKLNSNPSFGLMSLGWASKVGFYEKGMYDISNYAHKLGEDFLNNDYIMLPLNALAHPTEMVADYVGRIFGNYVFVKPNSGFKYFTGDIVDYTELGSWGRSLESFGVSGDTICVLTSDKNIKQEWRFWIVDNEVTTYSSYDWNGNVEWVEPTPEVLAMAEKHKASFDYLKCFTLDICTLEDEKEPKVVEINNIYTSGTYNCNLDNLLGSVREFELKEWRDIYG